MHCAARVVLPTVGTSAAQRHAGAATLRLLLLKQPRQCSSSSRARLHASPARQLASCSAAGAGAGGAACRAYVASSEAHLAHLAALLAGQQLAAGDVYCLFGAVGAGKSVFSRAFIRAAAGDPGLPVPSPTYLLQIMYDEHEGPPIHHFDLYRLQRGQQDMSRLDLPSSFASAVCLLEWAERLPPELLPEQRLEVTITAQPEQQQQQQQQQEQQQQRQQDPIVQLPPRQPSHQAGTSSSSSSSGSSCGGAARQGGAAQHDAHKAAAAGAGGDGGTQDGVGGAEDEEDEEDEEEEDTYADRRWRRVELRAVGQRWQQRLLQLDAALAGSSSGSGSTSGSDSRTALQAGSGGSSEASSAS